MVRIRIDRTAACVHSAGLSFDRKSCSAGPRASSSQSPAYRTLAPLGTEMNGSTLTPDGPAASSEAAGAGAVAGRRSASRSSASSGDAAERAMIVSTMKRAAVDARPAQL